MSGIGGKKIISKELQTIYDIAIEAFGNVESTWDILQLNPELSLEDPLDPGTEIQLPEWTAPPRPVQQETAVTQVKHVRVMEGQSLFDIALQEYGDLEGFYKLVEENGLEVDDNPAGLELKITGKPVRKDVVDYYRKHGVKPCTWRGESEFPANGDYNNDYNIDYSIN